MVRIRQSLQQHIVQSDAAQFRCRRCAQRGRARILLQRICRLVFAQQRIRQQIARLRRFRVRRNQRPQHRVCLRKPAVVHQLLSACERAHLRRRTRRQRRDLLRSTRQRRKSDCCRARHQAQTTTLGSPLLPHADQDMSISSGDANIASAVAIRIGTVCSMASAQTASARGSSTPPA